MIIECRNRRKAGGNIEHNKNIKDPIILDFGGDAAEAVRKLESILYTSGWNHYMIFYPDTPSEDKLLFSLIREGAVYVGEVYYEFTHDFTEELKEKAYKYFHRLRKRDMDSIYLNAVSHFSKYVPDIEKTANGALFYLEINAYVRYGDLSPAKLLELMAMDGCERVIIFGNGLRQNKEQPWEEFHSFEMRAPKEYIMQRLNELRDEQSEAIYRALTKAGIDDIIPDIKFLPEEGEP
jgi:hypothetical protein